MIYDLKAKKEDIYIWGTGRNASLLNEMFSSLIDMLPIVGYIDNDKSKHGKLYFGKTIYSPDVLSKNSKGFVYISVANRAEILNQISTEYPEYNERIIESSFFQRVGLLSRYKDCDDEEIQEILSFLMYNELHIFNYDYTNKYNPNNVEMYSENGLFYTIRNGKKLFLSRKYDTVEKAKEYYISLLLEQDEKSPHRYLTKSFDIPDNAIVVDAGAAEGIFSLDIIERSKKIYIFEPDRDWIDALKLTFADYYEKVEIIEKSVSNYCHYNTTTIDTSVKEDSIDFIKIDIEGEEYYALEGARNIIERSPRIKCAICAYHQEFAFIALSNLLGEYRLKASHSPGYMWFPFEHFAESRCPVLRRGLIYSSK